MAVLIEAISVVVRVAAVQTELPGGWEAFVRLVPNQTLCSDGELARVGFMSPSDVEPFVHALEGAGLAFDPAGDATDVAVVDQQRGLLVPCGWIEFGRAEIGPDQRVAAARLVGSGINRVATPPDWEFAGSLSATVNLVSTEQLERSLTFLRHEDGFDVYRNALTGEEVSIARAVPRADALDSAARPPEPPR